MMVPRDVEAIAVDVLAAVLDVPVSTRVPNPRPDAHVRVRRTGGTGLNLVQERPQLLVECWADGSVAAFDLARRAYGVLDAEFCGPGRRPSSPVNNDDPHTSMDRYQFTLTPTVDLESV